MRSVQDILLQHEIPNKISKSYVHKRWSQECGEEAVLELRTLSYDRVEKLKNYIKKKLLFTLYWKALLPLIFVQKNLEKSMAVKPLLI